MCVSTFFLKWGFIGYSLGIVQRDFTRRDHPGNPGRVSGSGPITYPIPLAPLTSFQAIRVEMTLDSWGSSSYLLHWFGSYLPPGVVLLLFFWCLT